MNYTWYNSAYKPVGSARFIVINILFSIILIQASVTCGASPRAYMPTTLAASSASCINPTPPNSGSNTPSATPGIVVINEVLTSAQSQWTCTGSSNQPSNPIHTWVEIYNPQNQPLDLYAARAILFYEVQGTQQRQVYYLPFGSIIAAHGFLVVFPFINPSSNGHAPISSVGLSFPQAVIDQVSLPSLAVDTSYARIPDGSNHWQITPTPTLASSNTTGTEQTKSDTSTATHTTRQKSTHTRRGSTSNNSANTDTPNTGVQPTWDALRLPSSESNNAETQQHNSSPSPVNSTASVDSFDLLKGSLFMAFIVLLLFALLWGWRLYRKRWQLRRKGTYL